MVVAARRIGLPDLEQDIAQRRARAVDYPTLDADALALRLRPGEHVGKVLLEDLEAGLLRRKPDVNIRSRGLRGRLFQRRSVRAHDLAPCK